MDRLLAVDDVLALKGGITVLFVAFLIAFVGLAVGRIKIKGVSLGTSAVFLVAILFGALFALPGLENVEFFKNFMLIGDEARLAALRLANISNAQALKTLQSASTNLGAFGSISDLGLLLFVTGVGLIAGPGFFENLKGNAKGYVLLGVSIIGVGVVLAVCFSLIPGIGAEFAVGILSGALTSTPAFSSAQGAASDPAVVALGYAVAYPFGVIGVVLFVQLIPTLFKGRFNNVEGRTAPAVLEEGSKVSEKKRLIEIDGKGIAVVALSIVLGLLLGKLTVTVGGVKFSLGSTGGPLIVAILLGHFGRMGGLSLSVPKSTINLIKELGLLLFLIGAGVEGGVSIVEKINAGTIDGIVVLWGFLAGVVMTVVPMTVGFALAVKGLKMPLFDSLATITGGMTSTPALGALVNVSGKDELASIYASTYPVALVLIAIASNLIITILG